MKPSEAVLEMSQLEVNHGMLNLPVVVCTVVLSLAFSDNPVFAS